MNKREGYPQISQIPLVGKLRDLIGSVPGRQILCSPSV